MKLDRNPFITLARAGALLLVILLLTPWPTQAQGIVGFAFYRGADFSTGARLSLSGSASHFPARITLDWGDGSTSGSTVHSQESSFRLFTPHIYANCGVKTASVSVSFNDGSSASASKDLNLPCPPAQPITNHGGFTCDIPVPDSPKTKLCRPVPPYFGDNLRAYQRAKDDGFRLPLSSYGYRCPDTKGRCPNSWLPGPDDSRGLSSPGSFTGSPGGQRVGGNVQRINADGIGVKWINDQKPIDAVDVWGEGAEGGGEVCFKGREGRLIFLDAKTSPRAQSALSTRVKGDEICGTMPGPGSVVYLPPEG